MTTATRTDIHRPIDMDPEQYEYVFADDNQRPGRLIGVDMAWWQSITQWPEATKDRGCYQCHHCGANIRYFAILKHIPTGKNIAVGETCLDNRFELESKAEFDRLRKSAQLDRAKQRIKTAAAEFVAALEGELATALDRETDLTETFGLEAGSYALRTITDMRTKLWDKYGNLSERQVAFVGKLIEENRTKAARAAEIADERKSEIEVEAPVGRVEFTGTVLKRVWKDTDFGGSFKLTIKVKNAANEVWLAWVSEPTNAECGHGDVVQMRATLTQSDDQPHFAFGKRPSNFVVIEQAEEV